MYFVGIVEASHLDLQRCIGQYWPTDFGYRMDNHVMCCGNVEAQQTGDKVKVRKENEKMTPKA